MIISIFLSVKFIFGRVQVWVTLVFRSFSWLYAQWTILGMQPGSSYCNSYLNLVLSLWPPLSNSFNKQKPQELGREIILYKFTHQDFTGLQLDTKSLWSSFVKVRDKGGLAEKISLFCLWLWVCFSTSLSLLIYLLDNKRQLWLFFNWLSKIVSSYSWNSTHKPLNKALIREPK